MLKWATSNFKEEILSVLPQSIIGLRIASYIDSYGFDKDFVDYWIAYNEAEKIIAVIATFEGSITVFAKKNEDLSELKSFLSMSNASTFICDYNIAEVLGLSDFQTKQGYIYCGETEENLAEDIDESKMKEVYKLICENIPDSFDNTKTAYLSFLSDYTYRKRRSKARGKCIIEKGELLSSAVTSAETKTAALISGVATNMKIRKGGYGKKTVLSLVSELKSENKKVYVIALNKDAEGFYEHIGFEKCEKIVYGKGIANV